MQAIVQCARAARCSWWQGVSKACQWAAVERGKAAGGMSLRKARRQNGAARGPCDVRLRAEATASSSASKASADKALIEWRSVNRNASQQELSGQGLGEIEPVRAFPITSGLTVPNTCSVKCSHYSPRKFTRGVKGRRGNPYTLQPTNTPSTVRSG